MIRPTNLLGDNPTCRVEKEAWVNMGYHAFLSNGDRQMVGKDLTHTSCAP